MLKLYSFVYVLIDFGFILSGAKSISLNKENKLLIDKIYSNIQIVKFLFLYQFCHIVCFNIF